MEGGGRGRRREIRVFESGWNRLAWGTKLADPYLTYTSRKEPKKKKNRQTDRTKKKKVYWEKRNTHSTAQHSAALDCE